MQNLDYLDKLISAGTDDKTRKLYHALPELVEKLPDAYMQEEFVVADCETTGFDPQKESLIEISACVLRGNKILDSFDTFVDPGKKLPKFIVELTSITDTDVKGAPSPQEAVDSFAKFAAGRQIIAHNAKFDYSFIMPHARAKTHTAFTLDTLNNSEHHSASELLNNSKHSSALELQEATLFDDTCDSTDDNTDSICSNTDNVCDNADSIHSSIDGACSDTSAAAINDEWLDSLALSNIVLPRLRSHKLQDLSRAFDLHLSTHRAIDDVYALAGLWPILIAGIYALPAGFAGYLSRISKETPWALRRFFEQADKSASNADKNASATYFSLSGYRNAAVSAAKSRFSNADNFCQNESGVRQNEDQNGSGAVHENNAEYGRGVRYAKDEGKYQGAGNKNQGFVSQKDIDEAFSKHGIAGKMYPNFEPRASQIEMAHKVLEAFCQRQYLALEANTGVGKSMAYLLPMALCAKKNHTSFGIATKTNALTDQLLYHELPDLAGAIGDLNYIGLKGYDHYVCLRKLERFCKKEHLKTEQIEYAAAILGLCVQSTWTDLDCLHISSYNQPRAEISASPYDCLKRFCPFYKQGCYLHGARKFAQTADIVVTNHALLFRNMMADNCLLPPIKNWVVDEAHNVENEARSQLSLEISADELSRTLNKITEKNSGWVRQVQRGISDMPGVNVLYGILGKIKALASDAEGASEGLFLLVKGLEEVADSVAGGGSRGSAAAGSSGGGKKNSGSGENESGGNSSSSGGTQYKTRTIWLSPEICQDELWTSIVKDGGHLAGLLDKIIKNVNQAITLLESLEDRTSEQDILDSGDDEQQGERGKQGKGNKGGKLDKGGSRGKSNEAAQNRLREQCADAMKIAHSLAEMLEALKLVLSGENSEFVYSAFIHKDKDRLVDALIAQRYDIGATLAKDFYPELDSVIFTSATLSTGDDKNPFGHFLQGSGLDRLQDGSAGADGAGAGGGSAAGGGNSGLDAERVRSMILPSNYLFDEQMHIILPTQMPEPKDASYNEKFVELLYGIHVALGGSVLTLFTNKKDMELCYDALKARLEGTDLELIKQSGASNRRAVQERFIEEKSLSLFALKSFWEGFDAPGDTLRCVVIARLPFELPTEPLNCERKRREQNSWWRFTLPQSITEIKQAAGRLIRSSTDEGFLVLADGRLQTKTYRRNYLNALPSKDVKELSNEEIFAAMKKFARKK